MGTCGMLIYLGLRGRGLADACLSLSQGLQLAQLHASAALRVWANMWLAHAAELPVGNTQIADLHAGLPVAERLVCKAAHRPGLGADPC